MKKTKYTDEQIFHKKLRPRKVKSLFTHSLFNRSNTALTTLLKQFIDK